MAKKSSKSDLIALDPVTKKLCPAEELPYQYDYDHTTRKSIKILPDGYEGLSVLWVENLPFYAKLKFNGISRTYSGNATADLVDVETGEEHTMYASEFNDVIDWFIEGGILEGCWKIKRKGGNYALQGVE